MAADHTASQVEGERSFPTNTGRVSRRPVVANPPPDLHVACAVGDVTSVRWALMCGADVSRLDPHGFRPLHVAAAAGHLAVVHALLEHGARIDQQSARPGAYGGCTPLHCATAAGHAEVVRGLLAAGASVEQRDDAGFTSMHTAARAGHRAVVKQLLLGGAAAEPYVAESTPLDLARQAGHHDVVALLRQVTRRR